MDATASVDKSWEEWWRWQQADPRGLVDYTFELPAQVRRLRDAAAQNSRNSSRPPSTDRPDQPKPKSLRKSPGRKPGGQPGHPGRTLALSDRPQHLQIHPLRECGDCGEDLSRQPALDFQRRQVFDLPSLKLECTEHRAEVKECPGCLRTVAAAFPPDVKAPVQYGKNKALAGAPNSPKPRTCWIGSKATTTAFLLSFGSGTCPLPTTKPNAPSA